MGLIEDQRAEPAFITDLHTIMDGHSTLILTGAGVSTDSGIPDYRGPDAPVRTPMTYQNFVSSAAMQQRYWARSHVGWERMVTARPNDTHRILARMQSENRLAGLITQNVDGLHSRAGHQDVIDLHGRIDRVICIDCRSISSRRSLHERLKRLNPGFSDMTVETAPDGDVELDTTDDFTVAPCEVCGGRLKPDVVFFGENVPKDRVARSMDLVDEAEALVVFGSSLSVLSGLRFVRRARKRSIPIAIVNRGWTRGDDLADLRIDAGCAETLNALRRLEK